MIDPFKKPRVLVVMAVPGLRTGMSMFLEKEGSLEVCGETCKAAEARAMCGELLPDAIVLDPEVAGLGLALVRDFKKLHRAASTALYARRIDAEQVRRAFKAGAQGYFSQSEELPTVVAELVRVCWGERVMSPAVSRQMTRDFTKGNDRTAGLERISAREQDVLWLLGHGKGESAIALELGVGVKTVETYFERLKQKLSLKDAAQLLAVAREYARQHSEVSGRAMEAGREGSAGADVGEKAVAMLSEVGAPPLMRGFFATDFLAPPSGARGTRSFRYSRRRV